MRHGFIEWHCTDGLLHVEAGDGGYGEPLAQPLVDVLSDLGWSDPDHNFHNCWMQPDDDALNPAAGTAVLTALTAFGYPAPP